MAQRKKKPDFEEALEMLEDIIESMESGELSLEESLKAFEQGIQLTRECQQKLENAEQRVRQLMADGSETGFAEGDA